MLRQTRVLMCLTLVLALGAAASAQSRSASTAAKRPMTFMDVMEMRDAGAGSISPDGKHVIYTVNIPQWKEGKEYTDIFVAPADGATPPRQMTFTRDKSESRPQWARDGRSFAFLSNREGAQSQLYLMRTDGGEARKLTGVKDGVNSFSFSRDGKWLAFSAGKATARQIWLVALGDEDTEPVQLTKHATPVRSWSWSPDSARIFFTAPDKADKDDEKRREKKFDVRIIDEPQPALHLWSASIADKAEKRWTSGEAYGVATFDISDDAQWVAFRSASVNRYSGLIDEDTEIYLLSLANGNARRVTNNKMPEGGVSFSPDSRWLVFTAADEFTWGRNTKLYLLPVSGGEPRKLLPEWDHSAAGASWSKDSKTLYFAEGIGVDQHLFALNVVDGKLTQLTRERGVLSGSFDNEAGLFLLRFADPATPADYYVATPDTVGQRARWVRVSNANPQVAQLQLGEYETVRWKASDGQTVEGILVKPVGYEKGKRYPLITQLHGGPASAYTNTFSATYGTYVHIYAANGYAVFQPNYRGSDNYGEKFRAQIAGDYFRQGYDDIITGVDYLIAQGIADPGKLGMMGWSAGGHWSNWTLTQTDRFKAISSGAGAVNWISMYAQTDVQAPREYYFKGKPWENWDHFVEVSPLKYIRNAKTPTLIHVGEADQRVPKPQSDELHMALKKLGVPVEYIVYPRMPHGITEPRYQMVKMVAEFNWFEKWIKGKQGWFEWKQLLATLEEPKDAAKKEERADDQP